MVELLVASCELLMAKATCLHDEDNLQAKLLLNAFAISEQSDLAMHPVLCFCSKQGACSFGLKNGSLPQFLHL